MRFGIQKDQQKSYKDLPKGAKWFRYRVSIHHPFGFNWHPLGGAGMSRWNYPLILSFYQLLMGHPSAMFSVAEMMGIGP